MSSNKERIEAQLCAYIDGDLTDAERVEIEQHLASNPQHRKLIEELRGHSNLLRALPRASIPVELNETLTGQLERNALLDPAEDQTSEAVLNINRWPQITAVAAVLLLAIGLGVVVYYVLPNGQSTRGTVAVDEKALKQPRSSLDGAAVRDEKVSKVPTTAEAEARLRAAKPLGDEAANPNELGRGRGFGDGAAKSLNESVEKQTDAMKIAPAPAPNAAAAAPAQRESEYYNSQFGAQGGRGGAGGGAPAPSGRVAGLDDAVRKSGQSVVTDKEVAELRRQLGANLGQANAAFDPNKSLFLVVTTPDAAVANGQVKSYFNANNILYMYMDAPATEAVADADADGKRPADKPAEIPTVGLKVANAGQGTLHTGAGEFKEGTSPVDRPPAPAKTDQATAGKDANAAFGGGTATPDDRQGQGFARRPLGLRPERRSPAGAAEPAAPDLSLQGRKIEEELVRNANASKAKPADTAAGAAAAAPAPANQQVAQRPASEPDPNNVLAKRQLSSALVDDPRAAHRGGMIVARMNRRQAAELSTVLSREKGQLARLQEATSLTTAAGQDITLNPKAEYGSDYLGGIRTDANRAYAKDNRTEPQQHSTPTAAPESSKLETAAAATPKPAGPITTDSLATTATQPARGDNYAFRWNAPAPATAPARGVNPPLALTPDPMDEPIDVVIVLKDSSTAGSPAAPTLSPSPADDAKK